MLDLCYKQGASAEVKATDDVTCSRRGVPFGRGRFQTLLLMTQSEGVKMRNGTKSTPVHVETYLTNSYFNWYGTLPTDLSPRAHLKDRPLNKHLEVDEMLKANDKTNCPLTPPGNRPHFSAVNFVGFFFTNNSAKFPN